VASTGFCSAEISEGSALVENVGEGTADGDWLADDEEASPVYDEPTVTSKTSPKPSTGSN
jgi:hypothetical protein